MLLDWFKTCLSLKDKYLHTRIGGSYYIETDDDTLYLYFQGSNGLTDWIFNFLFPRRKKAPYSNMDIPWLCHGGFLKVWDSVKPLIADYILDLSYRKIIIIGYSHGSPLAAMCHEYAWFHRPEIRSRIYTFGFGGPRMFSGKLTYELEKRWRNYTLIRNKGDIVTHLPPKIFGFKHVGRTYEIGTKGRYSCIAAHRPEAYVTELERLEKDGVGHESE